MDTKSPVVNRPADTYHVGKEGSRKEGRVPFLPGEFERARREFRVVPDGSVHRKCWRFSHRMKYATSASN
jgi:hypothetical protein